MGTDTVHISAAVSAAWAINDRAAAAMHMLAAARVCLNDRAGEALLFDNTDYDAALGAAARRVSEQIQHRCSLDADRATATMAAALTELRRQYRDARPLGIYATEVAEFCHDFAHQFWNELDDNGCERIAAVVVQTPVPAPMQLPPAAFAELALHAGSASSWAQLTDEHHKMVPDTDGSRGGCRRHEVHADLDQLPHEGLDLTRGAEHFTPGMAAQPAAEAPLVDADTEALAQHVPEGWNLVLTELINGTLYETCVPADPAEAPTRTPVNPDERRAEAAADVLLHLLVASDAPGSRPVALPADAAERTLFGGPHNAHRRGNRLAESAQLALQAHVLLYRSGGRARAAGIAARDGGVAQSTQGVPQLLMELCLAAGFAWRWAQTAVDAWDDASARCKMLRTKTHLVTESVADSASGCFMSVFGDDCEQLTPETVNAMVASVRATTSEISDGHARRLRNRLAVNR